MIPEKAENMQICKGAKDANTQRLKTCKHSKAQKMQTYKGENYDT